MATEEQNIEDFGHGERIAKPTVYIDYYALLTYEEELVELIKNFGKRL